MLKVQEIRELIKLVDESSIDEFEYEAEGTKVMMKKSLDMQSTKNLPNQPKPIEEKTVSKEKIEPKPVEDSPVEETTAPTGDSVKELNYDYEIKSPMVGTFYGSPDPESARYVSVGDRVQKETIVCIVEAMKLFNEIEAEANGEIVEILVEDGELVEYGQPLFRVKTK